MMSTPRFYTGSQFGWCLFLLSNDKRFVMTHTTMCVGSGLQGTDARDWRSGCCQGATAWGS
jgi:hypothetical protein